MSFTVQHLRSDGENRRPRPDQMVDGQIAVNTYPKSAGAFVKTSDNKIAKVGSAYVGDTPPPLSNWSEYHEGEQWFNTLEDQLYIWVNDAWIKAGTSDFKPDVVYKGQKGERGSTGFQGLDGKKGEPGLVGPAGASVKGDTGTTGATGSPGAKGDVGPAGAKGSQGEKGATGAAGAAGLKGEVGPVGGDGADGPKGATGDQGDKGEPGDKGVAGADSTVPGPKGEVGPAGPDGQDAYDDAVAGGFSGTRAEWIASLAGDKGEKGEDGLTGPKGDPSPLFSFEGNVDAIDDLPGGAEVGDVYLVDADGQYYAWSGTEWVSIADKVAELQGAKGDKGEQGVNGLNGGDGDSAFEVAVSEGFSGTETEWLASLVGAKGESGSKGDGGVKGEPGDAGDKGDVGDAGGDGSKGEPGEKGAEGATGGSAFDVAVNNGFVGDESTWLTTLVGDKGEAGSKGEDGSSAYDLAVKGGVTETEGEWLASLYGDKGDMGEKGETGVAGEKGDQGEKGEEAVDGEKGDKGDSGLKGEKGEIELGVTSIVAGDNVTLTPSNGLGDVTIGVDVPPGTIISDIAPADPEDGQLWWADTDVDEGGGRLYIWTGDEWVDTSLPGGGGSDFGQAEAEDLFLSKVNDDSVKGEITFNATTTHKRGGEFGCLTATSQTVVVQPNTGDDADIIFRKNNINSPRLQLNRNGDRQSDEKAIELTTTDGLNCWVDWSGGAIFSGNVGIGTTKAFEKLHLRNNGDIALRLQNNGTDGVNNAYLKKVDADDSFQIQSSGGTTPADLTFYTTSAAERMRIKGNGNVGIGTDSPDYILDINGKHSRIGDGTSVGIIQYGSNANESTNFHLGAASGVFRLWNGNIGTGTEILRINDTGGVSWNDGANFLDDYEEGSFTPSYSNATTTSHTRQHGRYTKIGNKVTCWIWLRLNGFTASGSAWVHIKGLPFPILNQDIAQGTGSIGSAAGFAAYPTSGFGFKGTDEFYLRKEQEAFTWNDMVNGADKCDLHCVFQYYV